ncbi:MAG: enoyl-CoA hydratase/isomerase family protein [Solirubrobacteraceae bacterium]
MAQTVHTEQAGRVLTVRLDNPPRNFMTGRMVAELDELVRSLDGDRSIGAVVITGAMDDVFITHFDVREIVAGVEAVRMGMPPAASGGALRVTGAIRRIPAAERALRRTPAAGVLALQSIHDLFLRMNASDKVFVAAINGLALGGGCELALACDVRLMADGEGRIGLPEITLGILPGAGGTQRLARLLGGGRALEMMLEGRALTPREAEATGLVHRVVAPGALAEEAAATAQRLARRAPATVAAIKRAVYEGGSRPLRQGLHQERAEFLSVSSQPAALRAMRAYVDQVERMGDAAPWQVTEAMEAWQAGTAVDLTD